jgi:hypothetical protein
MGKTYRKGGGFRPKRGRGLDELKHSRKFKDQEYFDKYERPTKKPSADDIPPIAIEEDHDS